VVVRPSQMGLGFDKIWVPRGTSITSAGKEEKRGRLANKLSLELAGIILWTLPSEASGYGGRGRSIGRGEVSKD